MSVACLLTACATWTPSAKAKIELAPLPDLPCNMPVKLPDGKMTQAQVVKSWGRDRVTIWQCRKSLSTAVRHHDRLRENLNAVSR